MNHRRTRLVAVAVLAVAAVLTFAYAAGQTPVETTRPAVPVGHPAPASPAPAASPVAGLAGRWLSGDMHNHISPPDVPPSYNHAASDLDGAIAAAKRAGLAWLVITPHAMDRKDAKSGRLWAEEMADRLARRPSAKGDPLVVLGWERSFTWPGEMTASFVDLSNVVGQSTGRTLTEIRRQGGLAIAAHPFFLPSFLSQSDKSWKPWTDKTGRGAEYDSYLSGLEIRHPMSPAAAATRQWDQWIGRQKRRIIGVGSTDDHWGILYPTTWVYLEGELTRAALHAALAAGRIVVGGDASAGSLTVTGDRKSSDGRLVVGRIGDAISADTEITINWAGKGTIFIDGRQVENETGPVSYAFERGSFHWVRLEMGIKSYSNPIYVNLPPPVEPKPLQTNAAVKEQRDTDEESKRPTYGNQENP